MERPSPITPDMRPCNNGCPLYGEVATFGDDLARQINTAQERVVDGDSQSNDADVVRDEALRCAYYRVQQMCVNALRMTIVRADDKRSPRPGRSMESVDIARDNPYL